MFESVQAAKGEWFTMGFAELLRVHEYLAELFLLHQESLIQMHLQTSLERLDLYRRELAAHMEAEEQLLLPVYERAGVIAGGPPEFFTGEHERMREFLERIASAVIEMRTERSAPNGLLRRIISALDEEAAYKRLVDHHDQRERNLLFPALDRVTTEDERRDLIELCLTANGMGKAKDAGASVLRFDSRKAI